MSNNKEGMTVEELLKPRYKVIADYPGSDFDIGNVLSKSHNLYEFEIEPGRIRNYSDHMIESYPHLFKRLEWWEERKPEEMPQYLKQEYDSDYDYDGEGYLPEVYKSGVEFDYMYSNESHLHIASFKTGGGCSLSYLLPATLAEYQQYINSKQQP